MIKYGVFRVKCTFCGSESADAVCANCGKTLYESSPTVFLPALPAKQGILDRTWQSGNLYVVLSPAGSLRTEVRPQRVMGRPYDEIDGTLLKFMRISEFCSPGTTLILSRREREILTRIMKLKPTREKHDEALLRIGNLHYLLARGLDGLGEWAQTEREKHLGIAQKAFSRVKSTAIATRNLGLVFLELGDEKKAMKNIDAALKEMRKDPDLWTAKGILLHRKDQRDESMKCFDRAIGLREDDPRIWTARGRLLVHMSRLEQALECFDEAIVLDRTFVPAWWSKTDVLARLGRRAEALEVSETVKEMFGMEETAEPIVEAITAEEIPEHSPASEEDPEQIEDREAILDLLLQVDGIGLSKAETIFEHGIDSMDNLKDASLEDLARVKGISEKIAKNIKETIESRLLQGGQDDEDETMAALEDARTHLEEGEYELALADYDTILESDPLNEDAWFNRGELLQALGKSQEAVEAFDEVISINKKNVGAWMEKANILLETGKPLDAVECYKNILEMEPSNTSYLVARANILAEDGHHEAAILCFETVLDKDPDNTDANLGAAVSLLRLGDLDRAEGILDSMSKATSLNEKVWWARGYLMDKRGRWGAAVQFYDRAISLKWNYIDPWIGKGETLLRQGNYEEAMRCFDKVLDLDESNVPAWLGKAEALGGTGQTESAVKMLDAFLETHPDNESALKIKSELRFPEPVEPAGLESSLELARAQREKGEFQDATDTIVKAIKENPNEEDAWTLLGDILLDVSDPIKLLNQLERETSGMTNVPGMLVNKGVVLLRLGMYANALDCFERALSIDGSHERAKKLRKRCIEKTEEVR